MLNEVNGMATRAFDAVTNLSSHLLANGPHKFIPTPHKRERRHAIPQQVPDVAPSRTIPLYRPSVNIPDSKS